jgi:DNA-binding HxlR family transcriptional regulator
MDGPRSVSDAGPPRPPQRSATQLTSGLEKALTASLRYLEAQHLVVRRDLSRNLLHVEYEISEEMIIAIESLLTYLSDWSVGQRK